MLLALLTWLYITFICFNWGHLFLRVIPGGRSLMQPSLVSWPIVSLTGLAIVGTIAYWLSIFLPIGLVAHLVVLIPVLLYQFTGDSSNRYSLFRKGSHTYQYMLAVPALLLVLLLSTYAIIHPDTTMYHASSIKWIERYRAVPGIVNIDSRLGYQSWWFPAQAIFRFDFIRTNNYLFLNGCVACWFLLFVTERIAYWAGKDKSFFLQWIGLFVISLLCWTQVRLTAASASPDFTTAIYILCAFYLFFQRKGQPNSLLLLIVVLSAAAIAAKLSAILVVLLPGYLLFATHGASRLKMLVQWGLAGLLIVICCIVHNVINSGYPLYPSPALNVFNTDWKAPVQSVQSESNYIMAYARIPFEQVSEADERILQPMSTWLPVWWTHQSLSDKCLLILLLALLAWNIATVRYQWRSRNRDNLAALFISLAGCCFWFFTAPDPRFGTGFLLMLLYSLYTGFKPAQQLSTNASSILLKGVTVAIGFFILAYSGYRLLYFFQWQQLLTPAGVTTTAPARSALPQATIYVTDSPLGCGFSPVPCFRGEAPPFMLRGTSLEDGFKPVQP